MQRLLAVVLLALVVGMATPNAAANDLEPDKGQQPTVAQSSSTDNFTGKFVPSIEQPFDITDPEHWDAEDLQELVDRYGCVAGFPDGTLKSEHPATRFEVATLIKACLDLGISIHEENQQHTNNTPVLSEPTPHPHEPAEHGHGIVAEHEHPINPYILISIQEAGQRPVWQETTTLRGPPG
ncbi:S-layer homology domain-containing protein [Candidatus Synechococcus spongiarum]|uniref:S-layer homology domain-containing protein n=1 Tax=Candidatus Synechococcus spongiarum TaxID=431041 RepID=UPI001268E625|nr:S-layer homology domain-containing protein [Candidatus Synechococcus spongiarum]